MRGRCSGTGARSRASVAWLLTYPDTYEIGLPNQGLQILYEILNERPDALAERAYAPWTDLEALLRASTAAAVLGRHPPRRRATSTSWPSTCRPSSTYTNVAELIDLAGVPVRAADRGPEHPAGRRRRALHLQPRAARRLRRLRRARRRRGGRRARSPRSSRRGRPAGEPPTAATTCCGALARIAGRLRALAMYDVELRRRPCWSRSRRATPTCPAQVEKRTIADLGEWPYPKQPARAAHRGRPRPAQRRGVPGLHPRLPLLPGRHDHPPGPGAAGRPGPAPWCARACAAPATTRWRSRRCPPPTSRGIEEVVADTVERSRAAAARSRCRCRRLRVDAFTVGIAGEIQKARRTGLTFAPEAGTWRMRQVINKLIREDDLYGAVRSAYSPGLAADEAVLPHRSPHRDRRGHARHRPARPQLRRHRPGVPQEPVGHGLGRRVRAQAVHAVPVVRPEHPRGAEPQDQPAARRAAPRPRRPAQVARPEGHGGRGPRQPRRPPPGRRHRGRLAPRRHLPGVVASTSTSTSGSTRSSATACRIEWYVYRHRTEDEILPWDHLSAGLHKDFLWQDWRDALDEVGLEDCRWTPCYDCGACTGYGIEHVVASAVPPAGGSQGTGQDLSSGGEVPVTLLPVQARHRGGRRPMMRVRLRFTKAGKVRCTSHRDVARMWERAIRRVGLPVAYSEGFSPRPKLHFGLALSTGHESLAEYLDIDLDEVGSPTDADGAPGAGSPMPCRSASTSPAAAVVPTGHAVAAAGGRPAAPGGSTCAAPSRRRVAVGRRRALGADDARPHPAAQGQGRHRRRPALPARPQPSSARPTTAPQLRRPPRHPTPRACGSPSCSPSSATSLDEGRVRRTHQWTLSDGARHGAAPGSAGATSAPHAEVRAS